MILSGKISNKHEKAITYFTDCLFTPQKLRHLHINVVYRKKMDCQGLVIIEDYNSKGKPIEFTIEVQKDSEEEMLKTLAHELVHVSQYSKGELNEEMTVWRGRKVSSEIPYCEQPWELEAEEIGICLYESMEKK